LLAAHSRDYCIPYRSPAWAEQHCWCLERYCEGGYTEVLTSFNFKYTMPLFHVESERSERLTLLYDCESVKPTSRSLRIFGAEVTGMVVSAFHQFPADPEAESRIFERLDARLRERTGWSIDVLSDSAKPRIADPISRPNI
jgi:hypothetical protein